MANLQPGENAAGAHGAGQLQSSQPRPPKRTPLLPAEMQWVHAFRTPVLMDCSKARRELGWTPRHSGLATLEETTGAVA